jgi:hypothetical protein
MNFVPYQFVSRLLPLVILLVGLPIVGAAQSEDVVFGFSDHSLIAGFDDSEIIERDSEAMSRRLPTKYRRSLLARMSTRSIRNS